MALEANKKFNEEMSSLHNQYEITRTNYMKSEKKIQILLHFIKIQEKNIQEIRTFMFESLAEIFK